MRASKLLKPGQKFNYLTVIKLDHIENKPYRTFTFHHEYYLCKCDCGNEKVLLKSQIVGGFVKSCGCYLYSDEVKQKKQKAATIHGFSKTRLYKIWIGIKIRCYGNPHRHGYNNYGGRGITMCEEWKNNFNAFREWALTHGYNKNAKKGECTIDRIDVNGNYTPQNCRFITAREQCNNRRKTTYITYKGETKPMADWCRQYGIKINTAHKRIKLGWDLDRVFNEKIHQKYIRIGKRKKNKEGG